MKKLTTKILRLILAVVLILSMSIPAFASESIEIISYEEFVQAQEDGYIGGDVTYDDMVQLAESSEQFLDLLENSDDFNLKYDSRLAKANEGIPSLAKGDVLITNGTSSYGLTGHAAIAIGSDEILSIDAPGENPSIKTRSAFYRKYKKSSSKWIKVYSPNKSKWGKSAAQWASNNYENSNATYQINTDINGTSKTYCSKIVFQAYKFGAGRSSFNTYYHPQGEFDANDYDLDNIIILPYALPNSIKITQTVKV